MFSWSMFGDTVVVIAGCRGMESVRGVDLSEGTWTLGSSAMVFGIVGVVVAFTFWSGGDLVGTGGCWIPFGWLRRRGLRRSRLAFPLVGERVEVHSARLLGLN